MITALSTTLLAQGTNQSSPDPNTVSPGLLGFVVIVGIGLALWFLLRSMNRHLRNVDPRFAERDDAEQAKDAAAQRPDLRKAPAREPDVVDRAPDEHSPRP